jgi:hypothetical protein
MHIALEFFYYAIFREFPVMRLRGFQYFLWDHTKYKIETLQAFHDRYDEVIKIFENNNFVDEYDTNFRGTEDWHECPSFEECKAKLLKLKMLIHEVGATPTRKQVELIMKKHEGTHTDNGVDPVDRDLLALLDNYSRHEGYTQKFSGEKQEACEGEPFHRILGRLQNLSR